MRLQRRSGILLHPTSLPGRFGVGGFGREAYRFVDFLQSAGQGIWQILPLGPVGFGESPYLSLSAFAGNPLLIDLPRLVEEGWLDNGDLDRAPVFSRVSAQFAKANPFHERMLRKAFQRFSREAGATERRHVERLRIRHTDWLEDYVLFRAIKQHFEGRPWSLWPKDIRLRRAGAVSEYADRLREETNYHAFVQYLFDRQWTALKRYANREGVRILGDLPLYVAYDSADAWTHPQVFLFDKHRRPAKVSGVPPDSFSRTGQLWGSPVYNWRRLKATGFSWWVERVRRNLELYDVVRFDHFRGLAAFWAVPARAKTAKNGRWVRAPGGDMLAAVQSALRRLPLVAEDLGVITPDVTALRDRFRLPGMKVLQFGFGGGNDSEHLPHNHERNSVVYTGTHDNNTTLGWYRAAPARVRRHVLEYTGCRPDRVLRSLIETAMASKSAWAILPLQDVLGLGGRARMNMPGTVGGRNWRWRFRDGDLTARHARWLKKLAEENGRV